MSQFRSTTPDAGVGVEEEFHRVTLRCEPLGLTRVVVVAAGSPADARVLAQAYTRRHSQRHYWSVEGSEPLLGRHATLDERLGAAHVAARELALLADQKAPPSWLASAFGCLARLIGDCQDTATALQLEQHPVPAWQTLEFLSMQAPSGGDA